MDDLSPEEEAVAVQDALGVLVHQCQALDDEEKQCPNDADPEPYRYHGDGEMYNDYYNSGKVCSWVAVYLCKEHSHQNSHVGDIT